MHKAYTLALLSLLGLLLLGIQAGCGGGAGLALSGGSVPIGGRSVSGTVLLPNETPVVNAPVTLLTLPSGQVIQTTTTNSSGQFTAKGVPTTNDVEIVVNQPPSNMLSTVISQSTLAANPGQPLNVGDINAYTTVVAEAIQLEQAPAPEDTSSIVFNQQGDLSNEVYGQNYSVQTLQQLISNPNSLMAQALTLMVPSADTELTTYVTNPNQNTAATALNGLLGYLRAVHGCQFHLIGSLRFSLISAQLTNTVYTPDAIAAALNAAGVPGVTSAQVLAASQRERTNITALSTLGNGITPFEALVIGADIQSNGGFHLSGGALNRYLMTLLNAH